MTSPQISRRTLLAAGAAVVLTASNTMNAAAAVTGGRRQSAATPNNLQASAKQGSASVSVEVGSVPDMAQLRYTITNVGSGTDTFTLSFTDQKTGKESKKHSHRLGKGQQARLEQYGPLTHSFMVNVTQSDGSSFNLGPLGPAAQSPGPAVGITVPPQ